MYADIVRFAEPKKGQNYVTLQTRTQKYKLLVENLQQIKNFLNAYERRGASIKTLEKYAENLLEFFGIVHTDKQIANIEIQDFESFFDWKMQENKKREKKRGPGAGRFTPHYKPTTICSILACFKSFFSYCNRDDLVRKIKQITPKWVKWTPPEIKEEQILPMLSRTNIKYALNTGRSRPISDFYVDRAHLFVLLLFSTGLRISEVANLRVLDLKLDRKFPVAEIVGKGNKPRVVPLSQTWVQLYQAFSKRYYIKSEYVFCTKTGSKLSSDTLRNLFNELAIAITGRRFGPHTMRHKFAIDFVEAERDLPKAMKILGHASLHTLTGYVSRLEEKKLYLLKDPLEKLKESKTAKEVQTTTEVV